MQWHNFVVIAYINREIWDADYSAYENKMDEFYSKITHGRIEMW